MNRITTYQAKYLANYLTRRLPANDINKLTASLQDAIYLPSGETGDVLFDINQKAFNYINQRSA